MAHPYKGQSRDGKAAANSRYSHGGAVKDYDDAGELGHVTPIPPSPFEDVKPSRKPRMHLLT